jgi:hypothetical protein
VRSTRQLTNVQRDFLLLNRTSAALTFFDISDLNTFETNSSRTITTAGEKNNNNVEMRKKKA